MTARTPLTTDLTRAPSARGRRAAARPSYALLSVWPVSR